MGRRAIRIPRERRVLRLAAGLSLLTLLGTVIVILTGRSSPTNRELAQIRSMAARDDPALAGVLDRHLVSVAAGMFLMGSGGRHANERPARQVYVDGFQIDQYEVTNVQYQRFVDETGARAPRHWSDGKYPSGQADMPVVGVSWDEASAYCTWAEERLPTEAEWEKACRGTDGRVYPWGNIWDASRANAGQPFEQARAGVWDEAWNYLKVTPSLASMPSLRPVGSYPSGSGPLGVMDMAGNAAEWVADWYNWSDYSALPDRNPEGLGPQWDHSVRGCSWYLPYGSSSEVQDDCRCAKRDASHAGDSDARLGFRCARDGA